MVNFDKSKLVRGVVYRSILDGKINVNEKLFFKVLGELKKEEKLLLKNESPLSFFFKNLDKSRPLVKFSKFKKSGRMFEIPVGISDDKSYNISMRWLLLEINNINTVKGVKNRLFEEISNINKGENSLVLKKQSEEYKKAFRNRINLRFIVR